MTGTPAFADEGLVGGSCSACARRHFPSSDVCPWCGGPDVGEVVLSTEGRLWAWTAVTTAPPGYEGPIPFGFGVVELPADGLRVVTRLTEPDPASLRLGQPMTYEVVDVASHPAWAFTPSAPSAPPTAATSPVLVAGSGAPTPRPATRASGGHGRDVGVVGTGVFPFGRHDVDATEMGARAVREALDEAGVDGRGIAAFCGTAYGGVAAGHRVLGRLGLTGGPIVDVEAGCASGAAALSLAATAIAAGQHDVALVLGVEKMPRGVIRSSFFEPWREQLGLAATPAYFALRAQRFMAGSGITKDQLARVVVKNRANGAANEHAMFRTPVTVDEVLASRMVCEPLHLFMLCSPDDGAAAVVLRAGTGGVRLRACALRSHLPGHVLDESTPLSGPAADDDPASPTTLAATDAYRAAGLGPDDLDLAEVQDTDAARELMAYEELGLCPSGGAGDLLDSGATQPLGRLPVNLSGGLLSKGEPLGASALAQVVAVVRQLEGRAGPSQVDGARVALTHTVGRGANASVCLLTK